MLDIQRTIFRVKPALHSTRNSRQGTAKRGLSLTALDIAQAYTRRNILVIMLWQPHVHRKTFDIPFIAAPALPEKQIEQNYRPIIAGANGSPDNPERCYGADSNHIHFRAIGTRYSSFNKYL